MTEPRKTKHFRENALSMIMPFIPGSEPLTPGVQESDVPITKQDAEHFYSYTKEMTMPFVPARDVQEQPMAEEDIVKQDAAYFASYRPSEAFMDLVPERSPAQQRLDSALRRIEKTPDGEEVCYFLRKHKVSMHFSSKIEASSFGVRMEFVDGKLKAVPGTYGIWIHPDIEETTLVSDLVHEARHVQQMAADIYVPNKQISPFDLAWFNRVIEADAQADTVIMVLEMKLQGDTEPFDMEKKGYYKDMYRLAEKQYKKDPASLHDGRLKRMVFDSWFCENGIDTKQIYDETTIESDWANMCARFKLRPDHGQVKAPLTAADFEALGTVAGEEINYMTLPGFRPLDDPYYRAGFTPEHQAQLQKLNDEWEQSFKTAPRPATKHLGMQG